MPITKKQLEARKSRIGASDVAWILGLKPFSKTPSPYDVWLEKTQEMEDSKPSQPMIVGNYQEIGTLLWAESKLGKLRRQICDECKQGKLPSGKLCPSCYGRVVTESFEVQLPDIPFLVSSLDGMLDATGEPVEAKASLSEMFGAKGTDEVPEYILVQCQTQMMCTGAEKCYVPALTGSADGYGGLEYRMYVVARSDDLIGLIRPAVEDFWNNHVITNVPPEKSEPHYEVLARIKRIPNHAVSLSGDIVASYIEAQKTLKDAKEAHDKIKKNIQWVMANAKAELGVCEDSGHAFEFRESHRKEYTVKANTVKTFRMRKIRSIDLEQLDASEHSPLIAG